MYPNCGTSRHVIPAIELFFPKLGRYIIWYSLVDKIQVITEMSVSEISFNSIGYGRNNYKTIISSQMCLGSLGS